MQLQVNNYDGPGFLGTGVPAPPKRNGIELSRRATVKTFRELGDRALNAADFERTRFLPIGRGRLACDPETGEFDPDAPRRPYNKLDHGEFPMHLHSTITEGEHLEVASEEEKEKALSTRKWSVKPLEKRKRLTLTPEDQLVNLKGQVEAERAGRLEIERRLDSVLADGSNPEAATMMAQQLESERNARIALEARVEQLMARMTQQEAGDSEAPAKDVRKRNAA